MDISGAESETYTIPQLQYPIAFNYRVGVSYRDGQGYQSDFAYSDDSTPADYRPDIDVDGDRLIEIYYLEELDAIRYQLDGSGYKTTDSAMVEAITAGCNGGCRGYELIRDLDFSDDNSYSSIANKAIWQPNGDKSNAGWVSIGSNSATAVSAPMILEGNGYTISNLYQNTSAYSGLFGNMENTEEMPLVISNIGLLDVDIQTQGGDNGGLVGACVRCLVTNGYVTGILSSEGAVEGSVNTLAGLVGRAISVFADNTRDSHYRNIYARVDLTGSAMYSGHLFGLAEVHIREAYARGYKQETFEGAIIGGLFDNINNNAGFLINSYATGTQMPTTRSIFAIENSYTTQNVSILKSPTTNKGIYAQWNQDSGQFVNIWDFGTSEQYPILRYDSGMTFPNSYGYDFCSAQTPTRSTDQPQCETFLPDQGIGLRDVNILAPTMVTTDRVFGSIGNEYTAWIRDNEESIRLELRGYDSGATITIDGVGTAIGSTMTTIALADDTSKLNIVATDSVRTAYTLNVRKIADITGTRGITIEAELAEDGTVAEGSTIKLTADIAGGDQQWTQLPADALKILEQDDATITVQVPENFVPAAATTRSSTLTLTVSNPIAGQTVVINQAFTIKRIDNGSARIDFRGGYNGSNFNSNQLTATVGNDPDGNPNPASYQYRWQSQALGSDSWTTVASEMTNMREVNYQIPDNPAAGTRYRVEVQYTDAQGYDTTRVVGNYIYRAGNTDDDGDGFIDIYYLEELEAIGSSGDYELRRNLDFNDPD